MVFYFSAPAFHCYLARQCVQSSISSQRIFKVLPEFSPFPDKQVTTFFPLFALQLISGRVQEDDVSYLPRRFSRIDPIPNVEKAGKNIHFFLLQSIVPTRNSDVKQMHHKTKPHFGSDKKIFLFFHFPFSR